MLFKRCWMWEKRKIGRTENIGTRKRERKREARKGERQTFIPGQTADDSSNKRLLVAKGWIGGRWLFRGSPGLNPRWRVLDMVRSGQSCENGRSSIRSFIGRVFPISSPTVFRSTNRYRHHCHWHSFASRICSTTTMSISWTNFELFFHRIIVSSHVIRFFTDRAYFIFQRRVDKKDEKKDCDE